MYIVYDTPKLIAELEELRCINEQLKKSPAYQAIGKENSHLEKRCKELWEELRVVKANRDLYKKDLDSMIAANEELSATYQATVERNLQLRKENEDLKSRLTKACRGAASQEYEDLERRFNVAHQDREKKADELADALGELRRIDELLARRPALKGWIKRVSKITALVGIARDFDVVKEDRDKFFASNCILTEQLTTLTKQVAKFNGRCKQLEKKCELYQETLARVRGTACATGETSTPWVETMIDNAIGDDDEAKYGPGTGKSDRQLALGIDVGDVPGEDAHNFAVGQFVPMSIGYVCSENCEDCPMKDPTE